MKNEKIELTREEMIETIIDNDFDIVKSGEAEDYLYNILKSGFKGYDKYTNKELLQEYQERTNWENEVKIVKERKKK